MKIFVDTQQILEISDIKKQVLLNELHDHEFEGDMHRRIRYIIVHKYDECFKALKKEWDEKLSLNGVKMVPTDPDEYAALVFSQPDYKNRTQREPSDAEFRIRNA
jgi:hypothetical protein